jgi:DNA-binding MarR family transcriptional regulator
VSEREKSAYRLALLIKRARRQLTNAMREHLEPLGTTLHTIQVLKRTTGEQEFNQLELARQTELEPAALCRLLNDLEDQRLIARRRDPDDNRRVLVTATSGGEALIARTQPAVLAGIEGVVSRLTRQEQAELARLLEKLAPADGAS